MSEHPNDPNPVDEHEQRYETAAVAETEQVAARLAATLRGGECIALDGDLGAGKTQFVRGLVAGLGGDRRQVSSPTYVLLHVYGDRQPPASRPAGLPGSRAPAASGDGATVVGDAPADGAAAAAEPPAMRLAVYHLDAYRASGADELEAIGFSELLDQGGVVVVEWASRIADLLPADRTEVRIDATGETRRRITVRRPPANRAVAADASI